MDATAYKKLNYSLALASTVSEGKHYGCIVNSLHQVTSSRPVKFSVSINNDSATGAAIKKSGILSITLLSKDVDKRIVNEFGYKSGRAIDKFSTVSFDTDAQGCPYLKEGMVSRLSLKVIETVAVGTHTLFICEIADAEVFSDGDCLTIKEFESRGQDAPPAAPVFRTLEENVGWKCTVCGYIRLDDEIPDDYICPICHAPRSKFVKR
ncbi:flavin reductase [Butyricicoccus sp. Marseille-Q5471]|uniref:flavin reductase n=1 Tax=Butyricicoccus sp. Marseille-Q5471 TaxID=3039493 RepID=UPI0024BC4CD3|nr:flavin reductase [Butyricicoccus sp. Marseille-Q5471]